MDWLRYTNQGAVRNKPLDPTLVAALGQVIPGMGLTVDVYSGGQAPKGSGQPRVGSTRHDRGLAADMRVRHPELGMLSHSDPRHREILAEMVRRLRGAGLTGIGMGPGYMGDHGIHVGYGNEAVWGADGRSANAPDWLRAAFSDPISPEAGLAETVSTKQAPPEARPQARAERMMREPANPPRAGEAIGAYSDRPAAGISVAADPSAGTAMTDPGLPTPRLDPLGYAGDGTYDAGALASGAGRGAMPGDGRSVMQSAGLTDPAASTQPARGALGLSTPAGLGIGPRGGGNPALGNMLMRYGMQLMTRGF